MTWDSWIGVSRSTTAWLDPEQANRMALTLDRAPSFADGDELPPAWHWLYFPESVRASDLGADGHPALGVTMPAVPLARRMWAGGELVFHAPLLLGTTATRTSTIRSVTDRQGSSGSLVFVDVEHVLEADGRTALGERQTIVYREPPHDGERPLGPPVAHQAEFGETWQLDNAALFRYSALTFNAHRIHYDADYSRDVEGYPGLVIHGPLLATLLLDLAVRHDRPVGHFRYRARSPLFLPDSFTINGRRHRDTTTLWAASPEGRLAMEGEALEHKEGSDVRPHR